MTFQVPPLLLQKIDEVISHYPVSKRSASLPLLHLVQEHFGYVSEEATVWIADKLGLQPINILELVTFYPMFRQTPIGKNHIKICRTLSCALGGAHELCLHIRKNLGMDDHTHDAATSSDGTYTVEYVECLASCGTAPVMMINDDFYEGVSHTQADDLLQKYRSK
ncbi:MAG: NAD(P)H-dependent oxidoreductase subunit E [Verrucomicrobiota bacterium]|nr:NAD(P)H-dependent oxidoreductase subunit E [Verrucomicrobiota bacterium]